MAADMQGWKTVSGALVLFAGCAMIAVGVWAKLPDLVPGGISVIGVGAGLLGVGIAGKAKKLAAVIEKQGGTK